MVLYFIYINIVCRDGDESNSNQTPLCNEGFDFFETLKISKTLAELNLSYAGLGTKGLCSNLANALKSNSSIKIIDLQHNRIGSFVVDMECLAEALKVNNSLRAINLEFNEIGSHLESAVYIKDMLKVNRCLTELNLDGNMISSDSMKEIALGLRDNSCLQKLRLWHNNIRSDGAEYLKKALRHNRSLKLLDLKSNNIDFRGTSSLCSVLKVNTACSLSIDIRGNPIGLSGRQNLYENIDYFTARRCILFS
uniref:Uncharacterized protein n=1 Tax=Aplanochytrium stocchinoi TaxID=215587 RepID=A0A7S3V1N9_9STRA